MTLTPWARANLAGGRTVRRPSRVFVAVVALLVGLALGALVAELAGCGDDVAPAPDAALPTCAELGCSSPATWCNAAGVCRCERPGLPPTECQR